MSGHATDVTLTGTFTDIQGNALNGTLTFTLSGFGDVVPTIGGNQVLPGIQFPVTVSGGTFSTNFYSNQIITPGPLVTFYNLTFLVSTASDANQVFNFSQNYQFGPGTFDLSQLTPINVQTLPPVSLPTAATPKTFVPSGNSFLTGMDALGNFSASNKINSLFVGAGSNISLSGTSAFTPSGADLTQVNYDNIGGQLTLAAQSAAGLTNIAFYTSNNANSVARMNIFSGGSTGFGPNVVGFSATNVFNSIDTGISRVSAGVAGLGTGAQGDASGTLKVHNIIPPTGSGSDTIGTASRAGSFSLNSYNITAWRSTGSPSVPDINGDGTDALVIGGKSDGTGVVNFGVSSGGTATKVIIGSTAATTHDLLALIDTVPRLYFGTANGLHTNWKISVQDNFGETLEIDNGTAAADPTASTYTNMAKLNNAGVFVLSPTTSVFGIAGDTGFSRIAANVIGAGNGTQGDASGDFRCLALRVNIGTSTGTEIRGVVNGINMGASCQAGWAATSNVAPDVAFSRNGAGVCLLGNGTVANHTATFGCNTITDDGSGNFFRMNASSGQEFQTWNGGVISWTSGGTANGTKDTSFSRISAGIIGVGTGAQASTAGSLQVASGSATTPGYAFGSSTNSGMFFSSNVNIATTGISYVAIGANNGVTTRSAGGYYWTSSTNPDVAADTGISRISSGSIGIGNGTQGDHSGNLQAGLIFNTRINPRAVSLADATSITPTSDTADINTFSSSQAAGTLTVNAPSGTPVEGQKLVLRLKSTNAQTYSFNATYHFSTSVSAPVTLTAGKTDYIGLMFNNVASVWDVVAVDQGHTD